MIIRPARPEDTPAIWSIMEPVIRAGETYTFDREMTEAEGLGHWLAAENEVFVIEADGAILGTYTIHPNRAGGGRHVCNCSFMTGAGAMGRGVGRRMGEHALAQAFHHPTLGYVDALVMFQAL